MLHPAISDWTDFARATARPDDRSLMQRHLDGGCDSCRAALSAMQRVATTAELDGALAPPAGAVRSAKAFFELQQLEGGAQSAEDALEPRFDSALVPTRAARSTSSTARQLLFESGDYTLELCFDHAPGEADVLLRGQILEADGEPRSHTPVFLVGGGEVRGRAISALRGTFELSSRLDPGCELWLFPDDDNRIRLSLTVDN